MPRETTILSVSLPKNLTRAVDAFSKQTDQTRSGLIRQALRAYFWDAEEDRKRFLEAYKATRKEKTLTLAQIRTKYGLD